MLGSLSAHTPLGISGYTFADLHDAERLRSLHDRFFEELFTADPDLWRDWDAYRQAPGAAMPPVTLSNLLIAMARRLSPFIARLFQVGSDAAAISAWTSAEDALFRFKVDFVRRRALPLLKAGAHLDATASDDLIVSRLVADASGLDEHARHTRPHPDQELALARAGCALLDREKVDKDGVASTLDALKRWCAARVHDPAYRDWVMFRFPETLDYWRLVEVQRPEPQHPEAMLGPDWRLRARDGFKLTDRRWRRAR